MPHIALPQGLPGIRAAMAFRPETAKPLNELVEVLLHNPNTLAPGERELIATYVSYLNDCFYCQTIHGAIAAANLNGDEELVKRVKADFQHADISAKLKALLVVAAKVQKGGKHVTGRLISKSTTRYSSRPRSVCTTGMSMGSIPFSPAMKQSISNGGSRSPARDMLP
jgi:AhpD family alkylhydroperoxidase